MPTITTTVTSASACGKVTTQTTTEATPEAVAAAATPASLPEIELKYWDGRGLMEVPRTMLAIAGMFPGDYKDGRYTTDETPREGAGKYAEVKDTLTANLGRMPVLVAGGVSIGQSAAINHYLATSLGMMGANALEGAQIVSIQEHLSEMKTAYRGLVPYGQEPDPALVSQWFNEGSTDKSPANADMGTRKTRFFKWYTGRIEAVVGTGGFAVGGKRSLADLLIFNAFGETLDAAQAPDDMPAWKREPFGDKAAVDAGLAACPNISAIVASVKAEPGIQKHLATRGIQKF